MEEDIIKTIKYNNHDLDSFFNEIFDGLYKFFDEKDSYLKKRNYLVNHLIKIYENGDEQFIFDVIEYTI